MCHRGVGAQQRQGKREEGKTIERVNERKGIEALRTKHPTTSRAIDALIEEEEQNVKQKRTKGKEQGPVPQPSYPGLFGRLL